MNEEIHELVKKVNIRNEQRVLDAKIRYGYEIKRLQNYLRVLKQTRDFNGAISPEDLEFIKEVKKIRPYIDEQIVNTDFMIRLLDRLRHYDFENRTMDETFRNKLGIPIDKVNRLISNGVALTQEEKDLIILFINS